MSFHHLRSSLYIKSRPLTSLIIERLATNCKFFCDTIYGTKNIINYAISASLNSLIIYFLLSRCTLRWTLLRCRRSSASHCPENSLQFLTLVDLLKSSGSHYGAVWDRGLLIFSMIFPLPNDNWVRKPDYVEQRQATIKWRSRLSCFAHTKDNSYICWSWCDRSSNQYEYVIGQLKLNWLCGRLCSESVPSMIMRLQLQRTTNLPPLSML